MSLLKRLLQTLGLHPGEALPIVEPLLEALDALACQEGRSYEAVAADLLALAQQRRQANQLHLQCWQRLTAREREVAALVSLGYSNPQIAAELSIALSTVKTHVQRILHKFDCASRADLQAALANWDLAAWLEERPG